LRKEVGTWREEKYPNTNRITRELLHFWFLNDERSDNLKLFFAQREAVETAIFLNEVAEKSNAGQNILRILQDGQTIGASSENNLPRIAFEMATGTGKTVVMAALIVYHYFNRVEYRNDTRFADCFLVVTPGVTIKNRLSVLEVDPRTGADAFGRAVESKPCHYSTSGIQGRHSAGLRSPMLCPLTVMFTCARQTVGSCSFIVSAKSPLPASTPPKAPTPASKNRI
jgi:hypothetical protein